ncbi:MAG: 30S ribosomal protein S5 [Planctomycetota bacterium]|nr:30S ribosomal protein S5 [Planctomycetota bacterium]
MAFEKPKKDENSGGLDEEVIQIYRCSKVVKGGRRFSFAALVAIGDHRGVVGLGYGKANEVPDAVEKAVSEAKKKLYTVVLKGRTIPHTVMGHSGASKVIMLPASEGTGVIAGKKLRPMLELAGIHDVLTKAYGSTSPKNLLKAGIDALRKLQSAETIRALRGVGAE